MPDYTVKADVDTMLRANDKAAIRSAIGVGTTDAPTFLAQTLTGQSLTGTQATSLVDMAATWNTTGNPSLIYGRVTNTNSGTTANLIDLGTFAGGTLFKVTKSGALNASGYVTTSAGGISLAAGGLWQLTAGHLTLKDVAILGWSGGSDVNIDQPGDLRLYRDATGILAQRNGTSAQAFRVYNSTDATPATNFDRASFGFTSNVLRIGTENGGSYTLARPIDFVTGGVVRMSISGGGTVKVIGVFNTLTLDVSSAGSNCGFGDFSSNAIAVWANGAIGALIGRGGGYSGIRIGSDGMYRFSDTASPSSGVSAALALNAPGVIEVNSGTAAAFRDLRVRNVIQIPGVGTTVTPGSNGDLVFETTSNTSVTLKLKGTDGTVRSVALTLA